HVAFEIGDGDQGVVERRADVHDSVRHHALLALLLEFLLPLGRLSRRGSPGRDRRRRLFFLGHCFVLSRIVSSWALTGPFRPGRGLAAGRPFTSSEPSSSCWPPRRGPFRVRALVCVRWPRTGRLRRWRIPR